MQASEFEQGVHMEVLFTPRDSFNGNAVKPELIPFIGQKIKVEAMYIMEVGERYPGEWVLLDPDGGRFFNQVGWVSSGDVSAITN